MSCGWPFHADPECEECKRWEQKYGKNLTRYMDQMAELKAAQRAEQAARSRSRTGTNSERDANG